MTREPPVTREPPATERETTKHPPTRPPATVPQASAPTSFETVFRTEFPTMFRLAHLLGARDPENVAQEAFARLHDRWSGLRDRARAGGYLRTTVVNLVRTATRHDAVVRSHGAGEPGDDSAPSAEDAALAAVSDAAMLAALRTLSPRHREALVLRFWLDASGRQIADAMGTSTGTAKSHVSRGLAALRRALADRGEL